MDILIKINILLIAMTVIMAITYIPDSWLEFLHNCLGFGKLETYNNKTTSVQPYHASTPFRSFLLLLPFQCSFPAAR